MKYDRTVILSDIMTFLENCEYGGVESVTKVGNGGGGPHVFFAANGEKRSS